MSEINFVRLKRLTLPFLVTCCTGDNAGLHLNNNISKILVVNITFSSTVFKEYSISFLMISRLIDLAFVVL